MNQLKQVIRRLVPRALLARLLSMYHALRAVIAVAINGWPGRGMTVTMITGTNGKTTTAAYLGKILEASGEVVGISTTAFYQIGGQTWLNDVNMTVSNPFAVQKMLRQMRSQGVTHVVFEQTAHGLDQHRALGVPYQAAAVTNLTQDHLDYFGTMERYAAAKAKLIKPGLAFVVLNHDDDWYDFFAERSRGNEVMTFGTSDSANNQIELADYQSDHTNVEFRLDGGVVKARLHLIGDFNALNALCAASLAHGLGIDDQTIKQGLESLEAVPGRMESIANDRGFNVFVDYAHATDALRSALNTLRPITTGRIISVYGACGDRDRGKRPAMGAAGAELSDVVIITDDEPYTEDPASIRQELLDGIEQGAPAEVIEIGDRRAAIARAIKLARPGDTILIAGMGSEQFRTIGDGLKEPWDDRQIARELLR